MRGLLDRLNHWLEEVKQLPVPDFAAQLCSAGLVLGLCLWPISSIWSAISPVDSRAPLMSLAIGMLTALQIGKTACILIWARSILDRREWSVRESQSTLRTVAHCLCGVFVGPIAALMLLVYGNYLVQLCVFWLRGRGLPVFEHALEFPTPEVAFDRWIASIGACMVAASFVWFLRWQKTAS